MSREAWVVKSYSDLAEFFQVDSKTISVYRKNAMPILRKGRYELDTIAQWIIQKYKEDKGLMEGEDSTALERYRNLRADLSELELEEKKGSLVKREDVDAFAREISLSLSQASKVLSRTDKKAAEALSKEIEKIAKRLGEKWGKADDQL